MYSIESGLYQNRKWHCCRYIGINYQPTEHKNCFYHFEIFEATSFLLFFQITDSDAPEGHSRNSMLALQLRDRRIVFCAESPDDMR